MRRNVIGVMWKSTGKEKRFQSWKAMAEFVRAAVDAGTPADELLPFCNWCNLYYIEQNETAQEFRTRMMQVAVDLHLI